MCVRSSLILMLAALVAGQTRGETEGMQTPDDEETLGIFTGATDIGRIAQPGSVRYDPAEQTYLITGSGQNMWSNHDDFYVVWRRLRGDFILRARVALLGEGAHPHRKAGWIVRSTLDADAAHVNIAIHGDGLTALQYRRTAGAETEEIRSPVSASDVIQLARVGDTFTMSAARFGEPFSSTELEQLALGDEVYIGLFVCSHDADTTEQALFRNVRIVVPAPADLVPYRDYLGSRLEILEIGSGHRRIVHTTDDSMQAPNWTPDGQELIYNRNGSLYRFGLESLQVVKLDTGFATNNNNDHVLSFDGRMLGISHHDPAHDNQSMVYTLPATGGTPRLITSKSPSYLHGWSPDGRNLVYTGGRDGEYDIYRIASDGGDEINLTRSLGLDDGSEYSPDGAFIYFNSVRSGRMQIWRMRPDGSEPEQVTDDELNNWFPHVSPDGKSIVFLSYSAAVDPADHPFYKQVYLRQMSIDGGEPTVIAYLYGGQGTINVPSWAPDSRRLAFVSNSDALRP